jgi:hypothetical protein
MQLLNVKKESRWRGLQQQLFLTIGAESSLSMQGHTITVNPVFPV